MITNGQLHYTIIEYIIANGFAPNIKELATILKSDDIEITEALYALHEYHGVVLHPKEIKIWVIHPFSLAPTNFIVKSNNKMWWSNCAWCSLGVAALLKKDATITTNIGAHDHQVIIHIDNGEVREKNFYIHFPIPMKNAWDNVIYTCSNMLIFENERQVKEWSDKHDIRVGDIQPISNIWELSKIWYGKHLEPTWKKWSMQEAQEIFKQFNLTHQVWDLEPAASRF